MIQQKVIIFGVNKDISLSDENIKLCFFNELNLYYRYKLRYIINFIDYFI